MDVDDRWHRLDGDGRKVRTDRYGVGKRFLARWRDTDGKQRKKSFELKGDAETFLANLRVELSRGTYVDPRDGKVTFKDYAEQWLQHQAHRPSTQERYRSVLKNHVYPYLGDRPLAAIRASDIKGWIRRLELAPSTVGNLHGVVAGIFASAVDDRLLTVTPFPRRAGYLPEVPHTEIHPPTPAEVEAVIGKLPERYQALVILAASTGLRISEALALTAAPQAPHRVDLMRGKVHVARSLTVGVDGPVWGPTKTKAGVRVVPLPPRAKAALAEHLARFPSGQVTVTDTVDKTTLDVPLLFTAHRGGPVRRNVFTTTVWSDVAGGMRFHDLRHFYASLLIGAGELPPTVQKRMGHATLSETLNTYTHLWHDADDKTVAAVEEKFGSAGVTLKSADDHGG